MKARVLTACLFAVQLALPAAAQAKGCLKGAAVGGVEGHHVLSAQRLAALSTTTAKSRSSQRLSKASKGRLAIRTRPTGVESWRG